MGLNPRPSNYEATARPPQLRIVTEEKCPDDSDGDDEGGVGVLVHEDDPQDDGQDQEEQLDEQPDELQHDPRHHEPFGTLDAIV